MSSKIKFDEFESTKLNPDTLNIDSSKKEPLLGADFKDNNIKA